MRKTEGLNSIEPGAFDAPLDFIPIEDGRALAFVVVSIAISLKRIADALEAERRDV